jgi:hypothetical protein
LSLFLDATTATANKHFFFQHVIFLATNVAEVGIHLHCRRNGRKRSAPLHHVGAPLSRAHDDDDDVSIFFLKLCFLLKKTKLHADG